MQTYRCYLFYFMSLTCQSLQKKEWEYSMRSGCLSHWSMELLLSQLVGLSACKRKGSRAQEWPQVWEVVSRVNTLLCPISFWLFVRQAVGVNGLVVWCWLAVFVSWNTADVTVLLCVCSAADLLASTGVLLQVRKACLYNSVLKASGIWNLC